MSKNYSINRKSTLKILGMVIGIFGFPFFVMAILLSTGYIGSKIYNLLSLINIVPNIDQYDSADHYDIHVDTFLLAAILLGILYYTFLERKLLILSTIKK